MKIHVTHLLIPCALALGCVPLDSPRPGYAPSSRQQPVSFPVSRQTRPDAPQLKRLRNGHYRVREPWKIHLNGRQWRIPAGYQSNGITASAKVKQHLGDGVNHPETWAAVFHDWLFTQPGISRAQADTMFYDILIAYGVPATKAKFMYTSVAAYSLSKGLR